MKHKTNLLAMEFFDTNIETAVCKVCKVTKAKSDFIRYGSDTMFKTHSAICKVCFNKHWSEQKKNRHP
jgi:hypothetical protein